MNIKHIYIFLLLLSVNAYLRSQITKAEVEKCYREFYLTSKIDSVEWNGVIDRCRPGEIQTSLQQKALNRINFFRQVNSLPKVTLDNSLCDTAQLAAFLTLANGTIDHYPGRDSKCYSEARAAACGRSLLAFTNFRSYSHTAFITGFIADYGKINEVLRHRKWLLYSRLKSIGYGATNRTEAIGLGRDRFSDPVIPDFTAYPWPGANPVNLIFPRWSFSIPEGNDVSFDECEIEVIDSSGERLDLKVLPSEKEVLDPTIGWTITGLFSDHDIRYVGNRLKEQGMVGKTLTVQVSHVRVNGDYRNFNYQVEIIDEPTNK